MYSAEYSSDYIPAAPVVEVPIRRIGAGDSEVTLPAIIDSGADGTMLPIDALQAVGARYLETRRMRGVTGHVLPVDMYLVAVQMGPYVLPAVEAIAVTQGAEAILGRDILNYFIVTLNGLAQVVEVTQ